MKSLVAVAMFLVLGAGSAPAADGPFARVGHPVRASLLADVDAIVPGRSFTVGVLFNIQPHWHTYWVNPGDAGTPTTVEMSGQGLEFGAIQWPLPHKLEADGFISYAYENQVLHLIPVKASESLKPGGTVTIEAKALWLVCKETCLEGHAELNLVLPVKAKAAPANAELFKAWRQQLPLAADDATAKKWIAAIKQGKADDGSPANEFSVKWAQKAPAKIEWFPAATEAVAIENVRVATEGKTTQVRFKSKVYTPSEVPAGMVGGVLVFVDHEGRRIGVNAPVRVPAAPPPASD